MKTEEIQKQRKEDVINYIYEHSSFTKKDISNFIDIFFDAIKDSYKKGCDTELRGFGTFELKKRNGIKNARNPKTQEKIGNIPSFYVANFIPGRELKNIVSEIPVEE